jgi:ABC-type amino acid transport substrate-binding protein
MLTGKLPYQGKTPYNVLSAHVNQPIPKIRELRPGLPDAMQAFIDKALAKEPAERYATAREMSAALRLAMNSPAVAVSPEKRAEVNSQKLLTLPRGFLAIAILVLALVGAFTIARFNQNQRALTQPENPTIHIAKQISGASGTSQWTFGCLGEGAAALVDLDCREIRIAVENHILPYNYVFLKTNEPGGMDYDMWWEICSRLHCKPVFLQEKWETLLSRVAAGEYDAASEGITIREEREQTLDFSISYLNIEQRLVVRKGESRFSNIREFVANPNLVVGALEASTNLDAAKQYVPQDRIRTYKEYSTVFYALTTGDIDAAIADQVQGETSVSGIDFQQAINLEFVGN